jgi:hypothetical protein
MGETVGAAMSERVQGLARERAVAARLGAIRQSSSTVTPRQSVVAPNTYGTEVPGR